MRSTPGPANDRPKFENSPGWIWNDLDKQTDGQEASLAWQCERPGVCRQHTHIIVDFPMMPDDDRHVFDTNHVRSAAPETLIHVHLKSRKRYGSTMQHATFCGVVATGWPMLYCMLNIRRQRALSKRFDDLANKRSCKRPVSTCTHMHTRT